jgi:septum formation topological specificity factor MinE
MQKLMIIQTRKESSQMKEKRMKIVLLKQRKSQRAAEMISKTRPIQGLLSLLRTTFMLEQGGVKQLIAIALLKE